MNSLSLSITFILAFVVSFGSCAPTGTGKVERRDTDKVAELKVKLQKLHHLLEELYDDDEKKEATTSAPAKEAPLAAVARSSEDMVVNSEDSSKSLNEESQEIENELGLLNTDKVQEVTEKGKKQKEANKSKDEDDSIRILAKALAHLQDPVYTPQEDSTGEYLSTRYRATPSEVKVRNIENVIKRAMIKLNMERRLETLDRPLPRVSRREEAYDNLRDQREEKEDTEEAIFHMEALRAAEIKLMRDVMAAKQLGVDVDEIIEDLQGKAYKESELQEVERQLQGLNRRRYE